MGVAGLLKVCFIPWLCGWVWLAGLKYVLFLDCVGGCGWQGGLYNFFPPKFDYFFCPCHNFFPLSSVQIIIIPACFLLCVLEDDM